VVSKSGATIDDSEMIEGLVLDHKAGGCWMAVAGCGDAGWGRLLLRCGDHPLCCRCLPPLAATAKCCR
jgi:hypothetical protein